MWHRIRFTYPKGRSHELRIAQVTDDGWLTALRAAKLINQDIDLGIFDDTYAKYFYNPKSSRYKHSYYYTYVSFLSLVGCRPEEALALVKEDIRVKGNRTYIRFNKSYSKGILLPHTKTHEIRLFPVNEQLKALLSIIPKEQNLLFPGVKGSYINHHRWRESNWRRVVNGLVDDGLIESYLKPYSLRHSFITRLVREEVDIATIGRISGNSPETIIKHYLAAKDSFNIPEL